MASFLGNMLGSLGQFIVDYGNKKMEDEKNKPFRDLKLKNEGLQASINEQDLLAKKTRLDEEMRVRADAQKTYEDFNKTILNENGIKPEFMTQDGQLDYQKISKIPSAIKLLQYKEQYPEVTKQFFDPAKLQAEESIRSQASVDQAKNMIPVEQQKQEALLPGQVQLKKAYEQIETEESNKRNAFLYNLKEKMKDGTSDKKIIESQSKALEKINTIMMRDPVMKTLEESTKNMKVIEGLLNENNPASIGTIKGLLVQLSQGSSKISDKDIQLAGGIQSFVERANQALETINSGKWTGENKKALMSMVNNLSESTNSYKDDYMGRFADRQVKIYKDKFEDPSEIREFIFGNTSEPGMGEGVGNNSNNGWTKQDEERYNYLMNKTSSNKYKGNY